MSNRNKSLNYPIRSKMIGISLSVHTAQGSLPMQPLRDTFQYVLTWNIRQSRHQPRTSFSKTKSRGGPSCSRMLLELTSLLLLVKIKVCRALKTKRAHSIRTICSFKGWRVLTVWKLHSHWWWMKHHRRIVMFQSTLHSRISKPNRIMRASLTWVSTAVWLQVSLKGGHVNLESRTWRWTIQWSRAIWVWICTKWLVSKLSIQEGQRTRIIVLKGSILAPEWQLHRWADRNWTASIEIYRRSRRKSNVEIPARTCISVIDWHRQPEISTNRVCLALHTTRRRMTELWASTSDRRSYRALNAHIASGSSTRKLEIATLPTARRRPRSWLVNRELSIENQSNKRSRASRIQTSHCIRVNIWVPDSLSGKRFQMMINCNSSRSQSDKVRRMQPRSKPAPRSPHNLVQLDSKLPRRSRRRGSWALPTDLARPQRPIPPKWDTTASLPEIAATLTSALRTHRTSAVAATVIDWTWLPTPPKLTSSRLESTVATASPSSSTLALLKSLSPWDPSFALSAVSNSKNFLIDFVANVGARGIEILLLGHEDEKQLRNVGIIIWDAGKNISLIKIFN